MHDRQGEALKKAFLCIGLALALACSALPGPLTRLLPGAQPSPTVHATRTRRPTRTPKATETLAPLPTETETPQVFAILTPTMLPITLPPSPVPLPTLSLFTSTPSPRPPSELDCKLLWQSPGRYAPYSPHERFGAGWNIRNIGTATWDPTNFRFVYLGGRKLSNTDQVSVPTTVGPGQSVIISVPMRAPWTPGTYTTHWGLRTGNTFFCKLTVTIVVP